MKLTLSWLKDYLDTEASLEEIATALTALGLEVDGIEDAAAALAPFRVAEIESAEPHPNADRLKLCQVRTAEGELVQVVCGAPNAKTGLKGVFAPPGSVIPATGAVLKIGKVRDVESRGMMVSEREMGLGEDHDGIIELPADTPLGTPLAQLYGLDDPVIEIGLTPNRGDCAGIYGIARDLAAAGLGTLKPLEAAPIAGAFPSPIGVTIASEAETACPLFAGRLIRGVTNGPSPDWLQRRLKAVGLRPISALVDVTNYLSIGMARPLHVFDADKLSGDIAVRLSQSGETLEALDDATYSLDDQICVIADRAGVQALGGVMGGAATGCTEDTRSVFIEAALFDPSRTARTGRLLGINSDARYRFERGVDPEFNASAMEIATRMILDLCGGEPSAVVTAGVVPEWRREIAFRPSRVAGLGGVDVAADAQRRILGDLGCAVDGEGDAWVVTPPSWRPDIHGEADLVEEVLRVHGYDAIPSTPPQRATAITQPALSLPQRRVALAKRVLAAQGLDEAVTYSFMAAGDAAPFEAGNRAADPALSLLNPISADLDRMRPTPLPNLILAAGRNAARGYPDLGLFEVGPGYHGAALEDQRHLAVALRAGQAGQRHWAGGARPIDAYDAKADALALLEALGAPAAKALVTRDAPGYYHPGQSGVLRLGPTVLAQFGALHPAALKALDVEGPMVACEVFLDAIPLPKKAGGPARPAADLPPLQPLHRDFAFLVDEAVEAASLLRALLGAEKALLTDASVFDVYRGKGVPEGRKSLAVTVTLQPREATLTEAEIDAIAAKLVAAAEKATGAVLRG